MNLSLKLSFFFNLRSVHWKQFELNDNVKLIMKMMKNNYWKFFFSMEKQPESGWHFGIVNKLKFFTFFQNKKIIKTNRFFYLSVCTTMGSRRTYHLLCRHTCSLWRISKSLRFNRHSSEFVYYQSRLENSLSFSSSLNQFKLKIQTNLLNSTNPCDRYPSMICSMLGSMVVSIVR